ncbi:M90 family metallopeptidase [Hymenobacter guriensis]|uniref:Zinc-dependent peptidase n=1 Tax=Hymenobacter guriensis TaxID=2793065 RepID=A0ABS0L2Q4_9BACT|nr:M90 family metallopeptidase [Hymenobacter guriensis]MBG8553858.1 zinc-dependent peptidase [Hymenobacter guriensis]
MQYLIFAAFVAVVVLLFYRYATREARTKEAALAEEFPAAWRQVLTERVAFYLSLSEADKPRFEKRIQVFLAQTRVTGIQTDIDDVTRVLVAASAIIPVFGFPDWEYGNLSEVLVVPDAWQEKQDPNKEHAPLAGTLLGSVRNFQTSHYMHLSKASLEQGFKDSLDRQNVGIHEFAHLLDEADGVIDGVPALTFPAALRPEWEAVMAREIAAIRVGNSEINDYAGTNEAEFFAVVTEYFFEKPEKLQQEHPELYGLLLLAFRQNPRSRFLQWATDPREWLKRLRSRKKFGRNDPCPCGSGKKYKECHLLEQQVA